MTHSTVYLALAISSIIPTMIAPLAVTPSQAQTTETIIYVDPSSGNDETGNGNIDRPLKSLSQAIALAPRNAVIQLASGTYSQQTGETFPIVVKKPVEIRGQPRNRGFNVKIEGGGEFYSRTGAGQNVGIVLLANATLTGVSVTNQLDRGTGVWIEDASPLVTQNTFDRNDNNGVSVNGTGQPTISNNYFYSNTGNGIIVYGETQPLIQNNTFERTGFGISTTQNARPEITGNEITQNRIGVIAEGNSQPILRNNVITLSQEDGVVAISNAHPDLGTANEPGRNTFRSNRGQDIKNLTQNHVIPANGNNLTGNTSGKIDFQGRVTITPLPAAKPPISRQPIVVSPSPQPEENPPLQEQVWTAPGVTISSGTGERSLPPLGSTPLLPPDEQNNAFRSNNNNNNGSFSLPPLNSPSSNPNSQSPQLEELLVLEPNVSPSNPPSRPNPNLLPVPSGNIPTGNLFPPGTSPAQRAASVGGQYRVVVEITRSIDRTKVQQIVPEAFTSSYQGRSVMQVGIFRSEANAEEIRQRLQQEGLQVRVIPL